MLDVAGLLDIRNDLPAGSDGRIFIDDLVLNISAFADLDISQNDAVLDGRAFGDLNAAGDGGAFYCALEIMESTTLAPSKYLVGAESEVLV